MFNCKSCSLTKQQVDDAFVENQVREEELHDWENAIYNTIGLNSVKKQDPSDLLSEVTTRYLPGPPSTASPMHVLCSVGRTNDTAPWLARQALSNVGVSPSLLDFALLRSNAAGLATRELKIDKKAVPYRTSGQGREPNLVRVEKTMKLRKKRCDMEVRMDKRDRAALKRATRAPSKEPDSEYHLSTDVGCLGAGTGLWIPDETLDNQ